MRRRRPTTSGFLDRRWFFLFVILAIACRGFAQSERYAVLASAVVQESPPQIVFTWPLDAGTPGFPVLGYEVFRKARGDSSWGAAMATLAGDATGFTDTNVAVGGTYEYEFVKHATNLTGYGYLWSGIPRAVDG